MESEQDIFFQVMYWIFTVLGYGWIPYILFGLVLLFILLFLGMLLKDWDVIKFFAKYKIKFGLTYIYSYTKQKTHFIRSYFRVLRQQSNFKVIVMGAVGVIVLTIIVLVVVWMLIQKHG